MYMKHSIGGPLKKLRIGPREMTATAAAKNN